MEKIAEMAKLAEVRGVLAACYDSGMLQVDSRETFVLPTFGEVYALHARMHRLVHTYRHRKDAAGKFARRIERELPHLKVFREYPEAGPTNNHAERCLRFAVTWRKRSCGTTSEKGDRLVERILSFRHTSRLQARSTFAGLVAALSHYARKTLPDLTWIAAQEAATL